MMWLISYDIAHDKRRYKVRRELESYGRRVQYSVFECELDERRYDRLTKQLGRLINEQEDSIRLYPLDKTAVDGRVQIGNGTLYTHKEGIVIWVDEASFPF
jgi:CRISPR-associated protein Cas2